MKEMLKLGVILALFCAVASGALAEVNALTLPKIEENAAKSEQSAFREVLPAAQEFVDQTAAAKDELKAYPDVQKVTYAKDGGGNPVGIIITVAPRGYSSQLVTLVGIGTDGKIAAVKVVSQNETPGLGTHAQDPWFQDQYKGISQGDTIAVDKDGGKIQSITASTVSSRAVTRGVQEAVDLFGRLNPQ